MSQKDSKIKKIENDVKEYMAKYKVKPYPTAYMEKMDRREPPEMLQERYQIYREIKSFIKEEKKVGLDNREIEQECRERNFPMFYVKKALKDVEREESLELKGKNLPDEEKERISLALEISLKTLQKEDIRKINEAEKTWKIDQVKSEIEKGMYSGLSKDELTDIAVHSGIEHGVAENLVETCVDDREERWFTREETKDMENYIEEELEMTHHF